MRMWMLNRREEERASKVREGVAMLKEMMGVGRREREVKEDIVIARGIGPEEEEVQTTTEWVIRRIRERNCSGRGREVEEEE